MPTERVLPAIRALTLALLLPFAAACDGDSPSSSSNAALSTRGALDFACGLNCEYEGEASNFGDGCATNVRGFTRLLRPDGSELANDEWQLDPARRINAGEAFLYGDCCFAVTDVNSMGSYRTELFWDTVPCG